ncbi:poly [ADP-ribose] polymerase 1-like isoform X2 [Argiope bruennichi]|uniref:poly [ADP-ribose] polymerase 1-like isoform X2 n=1 Tax=Argiope bruennichi TaxID=94029 RepID=UPI002493D828|nr:poly [ADP-ribose] polymerase 1-like isoform X2 [Argiope bruennichi]
MESELPFRAEYAITGRSSCKKCKQKIEKNSLRIAVMVQSQTFDGYLALWYHWECFFMVKKRLHSISQIANFDNLRLEDQEKIKNQIAKFLSNDVSNNGVASSANLYFSVEYATSSISVCRICEQKISKGEICILKLDNDSAKQHDGHSLAFHHVDCFVQKKEELGFFDSTEKLIGYSDLKKADQEMLENIFVCQLTQKFTNKGKVFKTKEEKPNDKQTKILELLDHLADCLAFGALEICPDCKTESLSFMKNKYICSGYLNEWTKCQFETEFPERKEFEIPHYLQHLLIDYKSVVKKRLLATTGDNLPIKHLSLDKVKIVLLGNLASPESEVRKPLQELGAKVQKTLSDKVNLCVISPRELESNISKISKAQALNINVVSEDFIKDLKEGSSFVQAVQKNLLSSGNDRPAKKFGSNLDQGKQKSEDLPKKATVTVKGAAAVDIESGLQQTCQVYQKEGEVYSTVLAYVDASEGKNSFYKLQILQSYSGSSYYLFRQWGRVGTEIGGKKVESFYDDVERAIHAFKKLFYEQTGNRWWNRKNFQKYPGRKYPLELDFGQDSPEVQQKLKPGENSRLSKPVKELVCLIFDEDVLMNTMIEFEIDLKKMPLGKISEKQIAMAYGILGEAQQILARGGSKSKITEVSNRFFTLIPHNFGLKKPPLLDNESIINNKIEMLDSLLQIEIAYSIIKGDGEDEDPIDVHYRNLKADIEIVEKDTDEYLLIEIYLKNTHAPTHSQYGLDIIEAFRINRHGESEKYNKFKNLHNKKLLWHGSRLTNFVGILSQGLRIAPPEAPSTGYMFGKGVYFADMVSKSANYCRTRDSIGLLLLCEVALGNMYQKTSSEYIEKLPEGKHSTLGMGTTIPDPMEKFYIGDVEVPYGTPVRRTDISNSQLQYNEYIVYDTNQINIKYLLKVNFSSTRY